MQGINFNKVEFVLSAASRKQFVQSSLPAVVFAGKSNVGKSSVINRVLNRKNFARVGNTPGKTIHVNYFLVDQKVYFVDLPGYGFANVAKSEKDRWSRLMEEYFAQGDFRLGIMIVDARHKPTADDISMAEWFQQSECPYLVLANKMDKLKKSEMEPNLQLIRDTLCLSDDTQLIPFSAEKGLGRDVLVSIINNL